MQQYTSQDSIKFGEMYRIFRAMLPHMILRTADELEREWRTFIDAMRLTGYLHNAGREIFFDPGRILKVRALFDTHRRGLDRSVRRVA